MSASLSLSELEANDPRSPSRGRERRFLCPLCGNGKPRDAAHRSFALNTQNGAWICHRCGEKGLLTDFWTDRPKLSRNERGKLALVRAFTLPPKNYEAEKQDAETDGRWREMWDASEPLAGSDGALYLERRGISGRIAQESGVRFSPNWYGRSQAVVFPILNRRGELIAANGRYINESVKPKTQTAGRKKHGVFASPDALSKPLVAVTEAPLDALTLWRLGIPAVAMVGTSWPDWLPTALAFKPVLVATDADIAGDEAAAKLLFELKSRGARPFRLRPNGAKDWNELLETCGDEDLRERLSAYSQTADDELRVNTSWDLFKEERYEEAEFIASLVGDVYTREICRASLRQRLKELKAA